nr:unnamed protein product [Spirometra erinaceieuropaei]
MSAITYPSKGTTNTTTTAAAAAAAATTTTTVTTTTTTGTAANTIVSNIGINGTRGKTVQTCLCFNSVSYTVEDDGVNPVPQSMAQVDVTDRNGRTVIMSLLRSRLNVSSYFSQQ